MPLRLGRLWYGLGAVLVVVLLITGIRFSRKSAPTVGVNRYVGSGSCRQCHERFYQLWSTSHHGLAMQPFTPDFARRNLIECTHLVKIADHDYQARWDNQGGYLLDRWKDGEQKHSILHVMGGKNVYFFLTQLERGRLQVLPLAYDVRDKQWYDTTRSMMRHLLGPGEQPVHWTDSMLTFNTSCYSCHVSQLETNYDAASDSYHTVWGEPGINCETCHGPAGRHVQLFQGRKRVEEGVGLISFHQLSKERVNEACSSCHAKASLLSGNFKTGDRFFDHFDLAALEDNDFYPDGRDLGENYTFTLWRLSPCAKSGKLDCVYCHTSSGRYRFGDKNKANEACSPCHARQAKDPAAHSHHKLDSAGSFCISCHMPMTEFARMRRSDHSMLPPVPAATVAFQSPNACNICHKDRDAAWADRQVRQWHYRDYQAPILQRARLVAAARRGDASQLPAILKYLESQEREEIFAVSLVRLSRNFRDERKWPAILNALQDRSPLVRSAAAAALEGHFTPTAVTALLAALGDESLLVRVRASSVLAACPPELLGEQERARLEQSFPELLRSLQVRPDGWNSHYNLGNYFMNRGKLDSAVSEFERASRLRPDVVPPLVNASLAQARLGQLEQADLNLNKALQLEPDNPTALLNLGLLLAEKKDLAGAEKRLRDAFSHDPTLAQAAYNLGVLLAARERNEALNWCRRAAALAPDQPRYAYTLAFYLNQAHGQEEAARILNQLMNQQPGFLDAYFLLGTIYESRKQNQQARAVYDRALQLEGLPLPIRQQLQMKMQKGLH